MIHGGIDKYFKSLVNIVPGDGLEVSQEKIFVNNNFF